MPDRLRPLWDFDDLDASERRFEGQLGRESTAGGRAEVLTQLARVEGLRGNFDACNRLLDEAEPLAGTDPAANIRLELERGRMYRSSGDVEAAFPLFQSAFRRSLEADDRYLAGDAAHMCAIATDDRKLQAEWTQRGIDEGDRYWAGPLLNNLGWSYSEDGEYERALELFRRSLEAREQDPENTAGIAWAQYAIGQTLRMLGRAGEAVPLLEQAASTLPDDEEIRAELNATKSDSSPPRHDDVVAD
jgi:tetratricopeptide (TPR) repeat protein